MKITPHFSLSEFTHSNTAISHNIDNTPPTQQIIENIKELAIQLLEPIRLHTNTPIQITSGYRCPQLNKLVKGSPTSAHLTGYAVDIIPTKTNMLKFQSEVIDYLTTTQTPFDQCILEKLKQNGEATWIHLALKSNSGKQRGQIFTQ